MQTPVPAPNAVDLPESAATLLRHFPDDVRQAYQRMRASGDPQAADTLVLAIVADHMPRSGTPIVDHAVLVDDLGFDSVAIAEMVFFIEDLLQVSVTNAEILQVRTVAELRAFVRAKLAALPRGEEPAPRA